MSKHNDLTFNSVFATDIDEFIKLKHGLGNLYYGPSLILKRFDNFCLENSFTEGTVNKEIAMAWFEEGVKRGMSSKTLRITMTPISHLAKFQADKGKITYIFPIRSLPKETRYTPHIYSKDELRRFFEQTDKCHFSSQVPLRQYIMPVFFRLLYSSGLRVSEAYNLLCENVDLENGIITVKASKNDGERNIPLSKEMQNLFISYNKKVHLNKKYKYFFPSPKDTPMTHNNIYTNFRRFLIKANISYGGKQNAVRIHDFRHTFAVHCLKKWVEEGKDLNALYPYLKTYMGHTLFRYTAYYLRITAEIYPKLTETLDNNYSDIIPVLGGEQIESI